MADYKATTFLVIMLSINIILFLWQGALETENDTIVFFDVASSPAGQYMTNGTFSATSDDFNINVTDNVNPDTGNIFTDTFKTVKSWFDKQSTKFDTFTGILTQPYGFLKDSGVPPPITTAFAIIWYAIVGLTLISAIRGNSQ